MLDLVVPGALNKGHSHMLSKVGDCEEGCTQEPFHCFFNLGKKPWGGWP
jgi:hypothetical protein